MSADAFSKKGVFFAVISTDLKIIYEEQSGHWPPDSKAFSLRLLSVIEELEQRVKHLEDRLAINSGNSSLPSSKDSLQSPKKRSMRTKSTKKPGGQQGHKGQGGKLKDNPDETHKFEVTYCPDCNINLANQPPDLLIRKQEEDLPPIRTVITEYQTEVKTCPCCAQQWQAVGCPEHIRYEFQYGPRIKALSVYLSAQQFLPAKRIKDTLAIFGVEISTGTLDNFRVSAAHRLSDFSETMRLSIIESLAGFFDETGIKVKAVGHWIHVAATSLFSLFMLHAKRGRIAHDQMGVLAHFRGVLHRDDYHSYRDVYDQAKHSLCCAHLIRDLKYAIERDEQKEWGQPMIDLLLRANKQTRNSATGVLDVRWRGRYLKEYNGLVALGLSKNPLKTKENGEVRGKTAQTKTCNLLLRFQNKAEDILRFMSDPNAEFTNNQAERDLRMNKVRQKISGGFRSKKAGEEFMTIRSFVATAVKRGADPVEELVKVFTPGNQEYMWLARHPE